VGKAYTWPVTPHPLLGNQRANADADKGFVHKHLRWQTTAAGGDKLAQRGARERPKGC